MNVDTFYSFGFRLDYTTFSYVEAKVSSKRISKKDNLTVFLKVANIGKVKSDEVFNCMFLIW